MTDSPFDDRCTLYISSCDKYTDMWESFFLLIKKFWPDMPYRVALASEGKTFSMDGFDIRCPRFPIDPKRGITWGALNLKALETVDTPYVLFMLEDFFLRRGVNQELITQCIEWMEEDGNIGKFMLRPDRIPRHRPPSKYAPFRLESPVHMWRVNAQAALWRKDVLIRSLSPHEHIWDWEQLGSIRSHGYPEDFYFVNDEQFDEAPIMYPGGGALYRGKWTFEGAWTVRRHGLPIDIGKRSVDYKYKHEIPY